MNYWETNGGFGAIERLCFELEKINETLKRIEEKQVFSKTMEKADEPHLIALLVRNGKNDYEIDWVDPVDSKKTYEIMTMLEDNCSYSERGSLESLLDSIKGLEGEEK